jgi:hypothetical protein
MGAPNSRAADLTLASYNTTRIVQNPLRISFSPRRVLRAESKRSSTNASERLMFTLLHRTISLQLIIAFFPVH